MRVVDWQEAPLDNRPWSGDAVSPGNFFPLAIGAGDVSNGHFLDTDTFTHQFADQLVVELEPFGTDWCVKKSGRKKAL